MDNFITEKRKAKLDSIKTYHGRIDKLIQYYMAFYADAKMPCPKRNDLSSLAIRKYNELY